MDSDSISVLFFILAGVWLVATLFSRARLKRLEARITELAVQSARHAAAGTVLHERIEALRVRLDADEERFAEARAAAPAHVLPSTPPVSAAPPPHPPIRGAHIATGPGPDGARPSGRKRTGAAPRDGCRRSDPRGA